jgi:tRNA pseudouridine13 synthase
VSGGAAAPFVLPGLPTAHGPAPARGLLRAVPEDFQVDELLGFLPDGSGGHALLTVEKRGANTGWVAAQLARAAGVDVRDVGWSGRKDRDALTRQAYTVPWPAGAPVETCLDWAGEGYRVVQAARHGRKLRPGSHRANRFRLRVRDLDCEPAALAARLELVARRGVPNYFGPQRFGRGGANLERALDWARAGRAPRERTSRAFALSAARSLLFNAVVAARVRDGSWDRLLDGEAVLLDGRRSFFRAERIDDTLAARCAAMDVHPSGPLWGRGEPAATRQALECETAATAGEPELRALLEAQGLEHERRSLRLPVRELGWTVDGTALSLAFELPRGAFATAVLHELLQDAWAAGVDGAED